MSNEEWVELKVQLARIEENVANVPEIKKDIKDLSKLTQEVDHRSLDTRRDLDKLQANIQWLWRTVGATVISVLGAILFKM